MTLSDLEVQSILLRIAPTNTQLSGGATPKEFAPNHAKVSFRVNDHVFQSWSAIKKRSVIIIESDLP